MAKAINVKIIDPIGLHARPASQLVSLASKFSSNMTLEYNGQKANLKSIMNIMALAVRTNADIKIIAEGDDEVQAVESIEKLMKEVKLI